MTKGKQAKNPDTLPSRGAALNSDIDIEIMFSKVDSSGTHATFGVFLFLWYVQSCLFSGESTLENSIFVSMSVLSSEQHAASARHAPACAVGMSTFLLEARKSTSQRERASYISQLELLGSDFQVCCRDQIVVNDPKGKSPAMRNDFAGCSCTLACRLLCLK